MGRLSNPISQRIKICESCKEQFPAMTNGKYCLDCKVIRMSNPIRPKRMKKNK